MWEQLLKKSIAGIVLHAGNDEESRPKGGETYWNTSVLRGLNWNLQYDMGKQKKKKKTVAQLYGVEPEDSEIRYKPLKIFPSQLIK